MKSENVVVLKNLLSLSAKLCRKISVFASGVRFDYMPLSLDYYYLEKKFHTVSVGGWVTYEL